MKNVNKIFSLVLVGFVALIISCADPALPVSNLGGTNTSFTADFTFANATVDAPSLDFYVNGTKLGSSSAPGGALAAYVNVPLTSSGATGSATANTSIRAKAATGTIGGLLGSNDLIYRSTNNGVNNFAGVTAGRYTVFAIDSIARPVAKRLFRITPTIKSADVTYYNPKTASQISASRRDSLNPANCPACVDQTVSTAIEYANLLTIGLVPLGLTDPGGVRYYVVSDVLLTFTPGGTDQTNAGIRFVNAVANANGIVAAPNTNGTAGGRPIWARLRPAVGLPHLLGTSTSHVAVNSTTFNPAVGSRTTGVVTFTSLAIAAAAVPIAYTLEVSTDNYATVAYSAPVSFVPGKNYTVFVRGVSGKTGPKGISHGIITH